MTPQLFDSRSMEVINTFHFPAMINDVDISPIREHILMAGGQDAEQVAATAGSEGQFEAGFYHAVSVQLWDGVQYSVFFFRGRED